jgi:hypothetical protein
MVRDVVRDAIFPMQLIDAAGSDSRNPVSDGVFEALIGRLVKLPLDDRPVSKWHRHGPHLIFLGTVRQLRRHGAELGR